MKMIRPVLLLLAVVLLCAAVLTACSININTGNNTATEATAAADSLPASSAAESVSSTSEATTAPATIATDSREVKFKDDAAHDDWNVLYEDRYVYYWSDNNNKMTEWPGAKMTKDTGGAFTYTIPDGATYIIFNAGTDLYQTVDIPFDGSVTQYQLTGERDDSSKYLVETWDGGSIAEAISYDSTQTVTGSQVGVAVEDITVKKGYYEGSFTSNAGHDGVIFRIKNNLDVAVNSVTMYVVFLDNSGKAVNTVLGNYGASNVAVLTTNDTIIQPGGTVEVGYQCDAEMFTEQYAVVAAYTTTDRVRYENSDAASWASKY